MKSSAYYCWKTPENDRIERYSDRYRQEISHDMMSTEQREFILKNVVGKTKTSLLCFRSYTLFRLYIAPCHASVHISKERV